METFSTLLALCEGNPPVTDGFSSQRPVTRSFDVSFDLRLNKRLSKQTRRRWFGMPSRSLWRHCNGLHYMWWIWMCSLYDMVACDITFISNNHLHVSYWIDLRKSKKKCIFLFYIVSHKWTGIGRLSSYMMTSSNGNIFRVTGICAGNSPVSGEFPALRPVTRSFDVFFDLRQNKRLRKQSWSWWFEKLSCPLWRHRNGRQGLVYPL